MKKTLFITLSMVGLLGLAGIFYLGLHSSSKAHITHASVDLTNMPRLFPDKKVSMPNSPYLVNVWGTWCASCYAEHPVLMRLAQTLPIIGINWHDDTASASAYLANFGNPYHIVFVDVDGAKVIELGVIAAPESFLLDTNGQVLWHYAGPLTDTLVNTQLLPQVTRSAIP